MKKKQITLLTVVGLTFVVFSPLSALADESENQVTETLETTADINQLFPENNLWEQEMLEEANATPIETDPKAMGRSRAGAWSWRDGVICITDSYASSPLYNNGHAGIMAASVWYSTVEANPNDGVRFKNGDWPSRFAGNQVWQVGVRSTSVAQDRQAALWAERQVGKAYNRNFVNRNTRNSFYCSQLVWAAYKDTAKVDLDTWRYGAAIHPFELHQSDKTVLIYRAK